MKWSELTIGRKIGLGFGCVIVLLIILGVISYTGVGDIVKNASEVIAGKALDGELAQKEVDHLNWAGAVNELITNDAVHHLEVQTDHTQCAFGKWLYGDGRKHAEKLVPELAPIFKAIEQPHKLLHDSAIKISEKYAPADLSLPEFISRKEIDHLNWAAGIQRALLENAGTISVETNHTLCGFGKWLYGEEAKKTAASDPELARLLEEIRTPHKALHESAKKLISTYRMVHPGLLDTLREKLDDHRAWAGKVSAAILGRHGSLTVQTDHTRCAFGKWLASPETRELLGQWPEFAAVMEQMRTPHEKLHESAKKIDIALRKGQFDAAAKIFRSETNPTLEQMAVLFQNALDMEKELASGRADAIDIFERETLPGLAETQRVLQKIAHRAEQMVAGFQGAADVYAHETIPSLHEVQEHLNQLRETAEEHILTDTAMLHAAKRTRINVAIIAVIALVSGICLALIISRGIIRLLSSISASLDEGAAQVASASGQIASSSQSMAEGASQQAASIEETSSSLEEMSSMTKQNASNASHADTLGKETSDAVNASMASMQELTLSMENISKASEETSKIIKTIDEIAFQTNLLALNAAVEAARAGEAGAGFAVVADEVRNLAMRAAEAAKDTSELIEGTTEKVSQGAQLVEKTNEEFKRVEENSSKIAQLVNEISAASNEQSDGIEQINMAVSEMDKVTQQNAANAEESASASEEMNAQASQMQGIVEELVKHVGGAAAKTKPAGSAGVKQIASHPARPQGHPLPGHKPLKLDRKRQEVSPDQVIPFDDEEDDFKDF